MYKNVRGSQPFKELAGLALKILSLPVSNAVVERVFSVMNSVKTKPRNKMNFAMLDAILQIHLHFHTKKNCCKSFTPSSVIYEKFTSRMYETKVQSTRDGPSTSTAIDSEDTLIETMTLFADEDSV